MKKALLTLLIILALTATVYSIQRNKVVVEIGTGTWCQYCPGAAMGADDLVTNGHQVAVIENHNGDPYANAASNARNTYYGITGYPTARFDGLNPYVGGNHTTSLYGSYLPAVNARLAVASHFTISATGGEVDNSYNISVLLNKVEADANTNILLHAVVTESHIQQAWQGQTHLEFVQRTMIPSQSGTAIDFGAGTELTIPLSFTTNPSWVINNCELVLFLQNNTTKEILQGVKYSFPEIFGAYPASAFSLNYPDTYISNSAPQTVTLTNYWNTVITGTIESSNPAFVVAPLDRMSFTLQPYSTIDYNVAFVPTVVGNATGNLTITSNFPDNAVINIPMSGLGFFNAAPSVSNATVGGVPVVSMILTADYTFTDPDANTEGTSLYQWYRISAIPEPVLIQGATAATYHLVAADIGNAVAYQVTPVDQHGMAGTPVMSNPSAIIDILPTPQNFAAQVEDDHDVVLTWEAPIHFSRNFLGYRIFRNGMIINNIMNPATLTFRDTWLSDGDYEYWVTSIFDNPNGQSLPSPVVNVHIGPVSNDDNVNTAVESVTIFPNPIRTNSTVLIKGKAQSKVKADIYNTKGQLVETLNGLTDTEGFSSLSLTTSGRMIPGVYFVKVKTDKGNLINKIVLMK